MAKRLDIAALIALVGEDRLREELAKTTYSLQIVVYRSNHNGTVPELLRSYQFFTTANPIEYFIFNNPDDLWRLYRALESSLSVLPALLEEEIISKNLYTLYKNNYYRYILDADEIPTEWLDAFWKDVGNMSCDDLHTELVTNEPSIQFFNGYGNYLLEGLDDPVSML